ncbi:MAG: O-antigen ligase family protein, partial [Anaerolinea sp.]|nr:O-antigen ligase family protein [Anaerolinea sp.]
MKLRTAICVLIVYLLTVGATFTGIVEPPLRLLTTLILGVCVLLWLTGRRGQVWSVPPLAGVILVWIAAVALSLIGNLDSARRILIGVWFAGAYTGAWFALHDLLATGRLRRADLINALLIAGGLIAISGYVEFIVVYFQRADFVRPGGLMGNPNSLAALLVIAIPFALSRIAAARSVLRVVMAIYTLAALALLGLTFSRGGWLGILPTLTYTAYLAYLWLRRTWGRFSLLVRLAVIGSGLLGALVIAVSALVLIDSFGDATRSVDLRTWIYATAVRAFAAQPITGSGLFTFGADLARYNSMPFYEPHNHAHNAVLHVAAELGVVGLIALALTAG